MLFAAGCIAAAGAGFLFLSGRSQAAAKPSASWNLFSPADWELVKLRAGWWGLSPDSLQVVGATELGDRRPFVLLTGSTATGRHCFVPLRGLALGAAVCRLTKPLLLFSAPPTWTSAGHVVHATALI